MIIISQTLGVDINIWLAVVGGAKKQENCFVNIFCSLFNKINIAVIATVLMNPNQVLCVNLRARKIAIFFLRSVVLYSKS